jgi:formylglycine-generating enzyme
MRSLTLVFILLIVFGAVPLHSAETRGLRVVARDPATNQTGEVRLYNKSYAVIIGIDRYQNLPADRQLQNAVKDALGVEEVLKKRFQFDKVITLRNEEASRDRIMRLLTRELPKEMGKEDALFIFWAGHGNQEKTDDGELGYLIPYDGNGDGIYGNITMSQLRDDISKALPAKHIFYAFDACYSGLLTTRSVDGKTRRDLAYLKEVTRERVRQVLTAGGKGEEALDGGPKGHSVFTGRFIEILENADDFITANELQASIKERVYSDARARNHTQTPGFGPLYGLGDYVFIPRQTDRLGNLAGESAARQKELEMLRKAEAEAAEAKKREQAEITKKQAELDALDKQIADMKGRLGSGAARGDDSLDQLMVLADQKEEQGKRLEELRQQREAEERKRQAEIEQLKREALEKRRGQIEADLAKFKKIAAKKYAQDIKPTAWKTLVASYPEASSVPQYDEKAFRKALGLDATGFRETATGMEFVAVDGGCFQMGDTFGDGEKNEKPVHEVCISDIAMGKYDVTVGQFRQFVTATGYITEAEKESGCGVWNGTEFKYDAAKNWRNPGFGQGDRHPVVCVSWNDALAFVSWLSGQGGRRYRLPTEAEWEYAARSGGQKERYAGFSNVDELSRYANFCDTNCEFNWKAAGQNDGYKNTSPVGNYLPNVLGLYDMTGNVEQWTGDWIGVHYFEKSPKDNPQGPSTGSYRVIRGGSWSREAGFARAASRTGDSTDGRSCIRGFRLVSPVQ